MDVRPDQAYFVTSKTESGRFLLQSERMSSLFIEKLYEYRPAKKYLLHSFVAMPNHFHLILTPAENMTLERAMQLIKGGFSHEAGKRFGYRGTFWQRGFTDRRIRNGEEYLGFVSYIHQNPVVARLCKAPEQYPFSSANGRFELDVPPAYLRG